MLAMFRFFTHKNKPSGIGPISHFAGLASLALRSGGHVRRDVAYCRHSYAAPRSHRISAGAV